MLSTKRCPPAGKAVVFQPNPASYAIYSSRHRADLPAAGTRGMVATIPLPGGRKTCMHGPGGGLIYVRWPNGVTVGVSPRDLMSAGSGLGGARRRRRRSRK